MLLDVAGQDATEAFEDVGHSDEAREILDGLKIGTLRRQEGDPKPKVGGTTAIAAGPNKSESGGLGLAAYAGILIAAALAFFVYQSMSKS